MSYKPRTTTKQFQGSKAWKAVNTFEKSTGQMRVDHSNKTTVWTKWHQQVVAY